MNPHQYILKPALFSLFLFICSLGIAQKTQSIRGSVQDGFTQKPMQGVAIRIEGTALGAISDEAGNFVIDRIPVGRHRVQADFLGYFPYISEPLYISSAREALIQINLEENTEVTTEEVLISALDRPKRPVNPFSIVSTRSFSVEETQRYAASVNDPGRMALSFAGVQVGGDEDENDIIVRGNSSFGMLWRLEGIDIPNPNHFARPGTSGGGITVFSAQLLGHSDFSAGAMAAEYGNAISGAFDIHFRKGNMEEMDHRFKLSLLGMDFSTEGPIKKGQSSYLVNYRYSTLSVLNNMGFHLVGEFVENDFQDLSFNLAFNSKDGRNFFTVFGLGGLSLEHYLPRPDTADWKQQRDWTDRYRHSDMGAVGATFTRRLDETSQLKVVMAAVGGYINWYSDTLTRNFDPSRVNTEDYQDQRISTAISYQKRFSPQTRLKAGLIGSQIYYSFDKNRIPLGTQQIEILLNGAGGTQQLQSYVQASHRLGKLTLQGGLHFLYLNLNKNYSIEPRLALSYQLSNRQSLSFAYGKHSQTAPLGVYFVTLPDDQGVLGRPNMDLDLIKSHHLVLSYDLMVAKNLRIRAEAYLQKLFDVPIEKDMSSTFWMLNNQSGYVEEPLISEGTGQNYGLDVTIEKFFAKHFFFLLNGSAISATYQALDGRTYNSRFNTGFVTSLTLGKEFDFGKGRNLQAGFRTLYKGGFRYTPADIEVSRQEGRFVPTDSLSYANQVEPYLRVDGRVAYRFNAKKLAMLISLDIQNILNRRNMSGIDFDPNLGEFFFRYQGEILPVVSFQLDF